MLNHFMYNDFDFDFRIVLVTDFTGQWWPQQQWPLKTKATSMRASNNDGSALDYWSRVADVKFKFIKW